MTATLQEGVLFARVRESVFGNRLTTDQVDGINAILASCPPDTPTDHLAYVFATAVGETDKTMLPIGEKGGTAYFTRRYDIRGERPDKARELGNLQPGDGALFHGRGLVQLTGRSNYRRATTRLRTPGFLLPTEDLEKTPDLGMRSDLAAAIAFIGMREGWFTGHKLSDFFGNGRCDPEGARRIINGQDRAAEIAGHFYSFRSALIAAGHTPGGVVDAVPTPKVETRPLPPPAAPPCPRACALGSGCPCAAYRAQRPRQARLLRRRPRTAAGRLSALGALTVRHPLPLVLALIIAVLGLLGLLGAFGD